jgi:hypothetical protein
MGRRTIGGLVVVGHEVHNGQQHDGDGLAEVERLGRAGEDRIRVA